MNHYHCFVLIAALCLSACRQDSELPEIPDDRLARVMADLYVAESATAGLYGYAKDSLAAVYYNQVFTMHGISKEVYRKELALRTADPERLKDIALRAKALLEEGEEKE